MAGFTLALICVSTGIGSCPLVLHISFSCVPPILIVLDSRGIMGGLGWTVV